MKAERLQSNRVCTKGFAIWKLRKQQRRRKMEFQELIRARRSVRAYEAGKMIDRSVLEEILKAAQQAPTWKNSQTGRYYVVDTPEKMEELRSRALPSFNQKSSSQASALIVTTFVRDVSGFTAGKPDNAFGNHWGAYDLGLQNAYLILKASDLGLDTLIMGIRDENELRSLLSIPENEEIASVIAVGYREGDVAYRERKELSDVAFFR
jgi:nitroreductase